MFQPNKTQPNQAFATMQRTFQATHVNYFGDGSGRDAQIIVNNGGLNHVDKRGMGNSGVHFFKYNGNVQRKRSPSPCKEPPSFYYQSDGTGRDSYVLKNNGGLRMEYNMRLSGDCVFKDSLRSDEKSPLRHFKDPLHDRADMTNYMNWKSSNGRLLNARHSQIQKDLIQRLTTGSPEREHKINYVVGSGQQQVKASVSSFQGFQQFRELKTGFARRRGNRVFSNAYGAAADTSYGRFPSGTKPLTTFQTREQSSESRREPAQAKPSGVNLKANFDRQRQANSVIRSPARGIEPLFSERGSRDYGKHHRAGGSTLRAGAFTNLETMKKSSGRLMGTHRGSVVPKRTNELSYDELSGLDLNQLNQHQNIEITSKACKSNRRGMAEPKSIYGIDEGRFVPSKTPQDSMRYKNLQLKKKDINSKSRQNTGLDSGLLDKPSAQSLVTSADILFKKNHAPKIKSPMRHFSTTGPSE